MWCFRIMITSKYHNHSSLIITKDCNLTKTAAICYMWGYMWSCNLITRPFKHWMIYVRRNFQNYKKLQRNYILKIARLKKLYEISSRLYKILYCTLHGWIKGIKCAFFSTSRCTCPIVQVKVLCTCEMWILVVAQDN